MRGLVLDTNLLVLLLVGITDKSFIAKHKRTSSYTVEDFELLLRVLSGFDEIVVTPNVVTETSNLLRQCQDPLRMRLSESLAVLLEKEKELFVPSVDASRTIHFSTHGLTDSCIIEVLTDDRQLITSDLDLYLAAQTANKNASNFNHLRMAEMYDA